MAKISGKNPIPPAVPMRHKASSAKTNAAKEAERPLTPQLDSLSIESKSRPGSPKVDKKALDAFMADRELKLSNAKAQLHELYRFAAENNASPYKRNYFGSGGEYLGQTIKAGFELVNSMTKTMNETGFTAKEIMADEAIHPLTMAALLYHDVSLVTPLAKSAFGEPMPEKAVEVLRSGAFQDNPTLEAHWYRTAKKHFQSQDYRATHGVEAANRQIHELGLSLIEGCSIRSWDYSEMFREEKKEIALIALSSNHRDVARKLIKEFA